MILPLCTSQSHLSILQTRLLQKQLPFSKQTTPPSNNLSLLVVQFTAVNLELNCPLVEKMAAVCRLPFFAFH